MEILVILWFVFVVLYFIGMTISWMGSFLPQSIRIMLGELLDIAAPPDVRVSDDPRVRQMTEPFKELLKRRKDRK